MNITLDQLKTLRQFDTITIILRQAQDERNYYYPEDADVPII